MYGTYICVGGEWAREGEKVDFESMKTLLNELQQELYSLGASVYQQAGADGTAAPGADAGGASSDSGNAGNNVGDDVIDAEFTESKWISFCLNNYYKLSLLVLAACIEKGANGILFVD